MPLLQECVMHPTVGIQRVAAETFGHLAAGSPFFFLRGGVDAVFVAAATE